MTHGNLTESEMKVVYYARAQSRLEAAELERGSERLKARHGLDENTCVNESLGHPIEVESEALGNRHSGPSGN